MLLDEIASYLQTQGLGEIDHEIFLGARPDTPDVATTLTERPSLPPLATQSNPLSLERPRLQVICRGATDDYLGPRKQAERVYQALAQIRGIFLSNVNYIIVQPSPPFPIGRDENARYLICVNAEVTKATS